MPAEYRVEENGKRVTVRVARTKTSYWTILFPQTRLRLNKNVPIRFALNATLSH